MAGAAAVVVSWLLATGKIDPNRSLVKSEPANTVATGGNEETNSIEFNEVKPDYKVPKTLFSDKDSQYPDIVSQKDVKNIINVIMEGVTEEIPNMKEIFDNSDEDSASVASLEIVNVVSSDDPSEETKTSFEDFELSVERVENENVKTDDLNEETTISPIDIEEIELTTIQNIEFE